MKKKQVPNLAGIKSNFEKKNKKKVHPVVIKGTCHTWNLWAACKWIAILLPLKNMRQGGTTGRALMMAVRDV